MEAAARLGPSRPRLSTTVAGTPETRKGGDTLAALARIRWEVQEEVTATRMLGKLHPMIRLRKVSLFLFRICGTNVKTKLVVTLLFKPYHLKVPRKAG